MSLLVYRYTFLCFAVTRHVVQSVSQVFMSLCLRLLLVLSLFKVFSLEVFETCARANVQSPEVIIELAPGAQNGEGRDGKGQSTGSDDLRFPASGSSFFGQGVSGVDGSLENLGKPSKHSPSDSLFAPGLSSIGGATAPSPVIIHASPATGYATRLQSGPYLSGRLGIHYGGVPLSRFMPVRSAFSLLPNLITAGWRLQSGSFGLNESQDSYGHFLILQPCHLQSCFPPHPGLTRFMVASELRQFQSLDSGTAIGFTSRGLESWSSLPHIDSSYLGLEISRDRGRTRVRDDRNTPRREADDRFVELTNNDLTRVSGVQTMAFKLPSLRSRVDSHLLVSEIEQGLDLGPQAVTNDGRSLQRLALGEVRSKTLIGETGDRVSFRLKGLLHDQSTLRSPYELERSNSSASQHWGEIGLGFLTRVGESFGLRQFYIDVATSSSHANQRSLTMTGNQKSSDFRFYEQSQRVGFIYNLNWFLEGLSFSSAGALKIRQESAESKCLNDSFFNCSGPQTRMVQAAPQIGGALNLSRQSWSGSIYLSKYGKLPELYERFGHPNGIRPNLQLKQEERVSFGGSVQVAGFESGYLFAQDQDLIWPVTQSNMSVQFENRGAAYWHYGHLAYGGDITKEIGLNARFELTRAWFQGRPSKQVPGVPFVKIQTQTRYELASHWQTVLGRARTFASLTGNFVGSTYVDDLNWVERSPYVQMSPSLSQVFQQGDGRRIAAELGIDLAFPEASRVRDTLGGEFLEYSLGTGGYASSGHRLRFGVRGDF